MSMPMPMPMPMPAPAPEPSTNNQTMAMMQMTFFWGKDVVLLFSGWPGSGRLGMYLLALLLVFLVAAAVETFSLPPTLKLPGIHPGAGAAVHAAVYGVRMALAYFVMLAVMSFNVGVFLVAVAGHATGRFAVKYRELAATGGLDGES